MKNVNYDELSIQELEIDIQKLRQARAEIRAQQEAAARAMEKKIEAEALQRKLAVMSDAEKAALVQAIQAEGIGSQAGVGIPGAN